MISVNYYDPELGGWQQQQVSRLPVNAQHTPPLWLDLQQASAAEEQQLLQDLGIAATMAEDFSKTRHPPKFEAVGDFNLLILRAYADADFSELTESAQLNLLFCHDILITKLHCRQQPLCSQQQPQLAKPSANQISDWVKQLTLIVAASYLEKLLVFEDELGELEDRMLHKGNDELMTMMMRYRSVLRKVSRNLAYQKDLFADALFEEQHSLLRRFALADLRDFYEKFERLHSMTEMYYDQLSDLVQGYLSTTSHQINERMKVLTMVSSIFIPLTFVAGIYGMNFSNMPELELEWGYYLTLGFMLAVGLGSLIWFKHLKWW
ncbi:MAG: magnesium transporter CorA family protein [Alishewanella aestuarii]